MKDFDLQKALSGHPLVTRGGDKIVKFEQLCDKNSTFPFHVKTKNSSYSVTLSGKVYVHGNTDYDLFLDEPELKEGDTIEVLYSDWIPVILLHIDKNDRAIFVVPEDEDKYNNSKYYNIGACSSSNWRIPSKESSKEESLLDIAMDLTKIAERLGYWGVKK